MSLYCNNHRFKLKSDGSDSQYLQCHCGKVELLESNENLKKPYPLSVLIMTGICMLPLFWLQWEMLTR